MALLVFAASGLWAQFYTTLPREERRTLAEAYYLVGQQYEQRGDNQKAQNFKDMAFNIDPGLDPANIQLKDLPSAAALILEGKALLKEDPGKGIEKVKEGLEKFEESLAKIEELSKFGYDYTALISRIEDLKTLFNALIDEYNSLGKNEDNLTNYMLKWSYVF